VVVGVSGGADSLALVDMLARRKRLQPVEAPMLGLHVRLRGDGVRGELPEEVVAWCHDRGVEVEIVEPRIEPSETFPLTCFRCAGIRRRTLLEAADERGVRRVALGHHADDAVETWLVSLFYSGTGDVLPPYRTYFDGMMTVVRPLFEAPALAIRRVARLCGYPVTASGCAVEESAKRDRVRAVLSALGRDEKRVRRVLFKKIVRIFEEGAEDGVV
jgi:tRNA 2-thiocytidine biosynthesis protein TtcA